MPGDTVWAADPETREQNLKEVVQIFVNETDELIHVSVAGEEIVTTPEHPFYVPQKGWTDAILLRDGDILVLVNGEYVTVEKVQHEILESPVKVYNFEVEDYHTYYAGENCVLVHNDCKKKPTSTNQMQQQVEKGQAPKEVDRVDPPHVSGQQPHVHFTNGTSLNMDGTVHDKMNGVPVLTKKVRIWLNKNNWSVN